MFVMLNMDGCWICDVEMDGFYKATGTQNTKEISEKKNSTAGILHIEVGINGCDMVQNLFYEGMRN